MYGERGAHAMVRVWQKRVLALLEYYEQSVDSVDVDWKGMPATVADEGDIADISAMKTVAKKRLESVLKLVP
eukprot:6474530-Amphidinium_carterae.1